MKRPYIARRWYGAPDERIVEGWAIAIILLVILAICGPTP